MTPGDRLRSALRLPARTRASLASGLLGDLVRAGDRQAGFERAALVSVFTLFLLSDQWTSRLARVAPLPAVIAGTVGVFVAALLLRCHRRPLFWIAAAAAILASLVPRWWTTDDHVFLVGYWCLAVGLAALDTDAAGSLARHARRLLGLVFLFATAWKLLSWDYVSGTMFHYLLLVDPRFTRLTGLAGAIPAAELAANFTDVVALRRDALPSVALADAPAVGALAGLLTWVTVAIEGALAAAFLLPEGRVPAWARDALFLAFLAGTYTVAPVLLFGVLLVAMGVAQASPRAVIAYLAMLIWIYVMAGIFNYAL